MAAKWVYYTKGVAIGTEVSVRYRESDRLSGVVVKRGSTVVAAATIQANTVYGIPPCNSKEYW